MHRASTSVHHIKVGFGKTEVAVLLDAVTVVDELTDLDSFRKRRQSADMVAMEMRGNEKVEPADASILHRRVDTTRFAVIGSIPSGIHQD